MAYNDTPLPTETPAQSQPLIRQNFKQIADSYNTDHIPFTGSPQGYSNKTTFVSQASDPTKVVNAGIAYTKTPAAHTELYYEGEAGTGSVLQITNQALTTASGEGFMPGGLQIRSGSSTASIAGVTVNFTSAFPVACVSVVVCAFNSGNQVNVGSIAAGGGSFVAKSPQGNCSIFYIATGY
jgi:hypothetical protein